MTNLFKTKQGVAAILAVVIVGAVALIITKSLALMGIDELGSIGAYSSGEKARAVAESCLEEGLRRVQLDDSYLAADESLNITGGSCTLTITENGSERDLAVAAIYENSYRYYETKVELMDDHLELLNYREIVSD